LLDGQGQIGSKGIASAHDLILAAEERLATVP
jgi:hypothetical protein